MDKSQSDEPNELAAVVGDSNNAALDDSFEESRETKKRKHENRSIDEFKTKFHNNFKSDAVQNNCRKTLVGDTLASGDDIALEKNCKDNYVDANDNMKLPTTNMDTSNNSNEQNYATPKSISDVSSIVEEQLEMIGRSLDENNSVISPSGNQDYEFKPALCDTGGNEVQIKPDSEDSLHLQTEKLESQGDDNNRSLDELSTMDSNAERSFHRSESPEAVKIPDTDISVEDAPGDESDTNLAGCHNWFSYKAIRNREYGLASGKSPDWFRYKAIGSLHMVQRFELMSKLDNHEGCVNCLHFNASGSRLASGSDDLNVCIWDWAIDKPVFTFSTGHHQNVFQAKFMPLSGDCHIVTCARDGQVRLAELSVQGVCKGTRKLAQHKGAAHKLALELDSPHIFLTCGEDGVVFELDLRDPKANKLLTCKDAPEGGKSVPLYSIHSHPQNPYYFAVCGRDQYSRIYDKRYANGANPVKKFCPEHLNSDEPSHKANITCIVFNHDGSELLASYNDDDIFLFDVNGNRGNSDNVIKRYTGHRNNATVKGVNFYGPSSEYVITGSDCGYIYFWEKESEKVVQYLQGDEQGVINVLEPHPTAAFLATSGLDHDIKLWVPSNEDPKFDRRLLKKLTTRNTRDREDDRRADTDIFDSNMLYLLLSRMRRRRRRSQSGEQGETNNDAEDGSGEPSEDSGPGSESDDDADGPQALQCRTS